MYQEVLQGNLGTAVLRGLDIIESFLEVSSVLKRALELTAVETHGFPSQVFLLLVKRLDKLKGKEATVKSY